MTAPQKRRLLIVALLVPFVIFLIFILQHGLDAAPNWVPFAVAGYLLFAMILASVVAPRISGAESPRSSVIMSDAQIAAVSRAKALILVWSALFIYGTYRTLNGDFPLSRAIPAGLLLLGFIAVFVRMILRVNKRQSMERSQFP
jgi:hypothetical protein